MSVKTYKFYMFKVWLNIIIAIPKIMGIIHQL